MIGLDFLKGAPPSHTAHQTEPVYLPDSATAPIGAGDFNLIRMVEEHGPLRIQEITKELQELSNRMTRLESERMRLERLVEATK